MRIFSLATDEAVAVGDDIVIKVLEINGEEVELGIEHPDGTSIASGRGLRFHGDSWTRRLQSAAIHESRGCRAPEEQP